MGLWKRFRTPQLSPSRRLVVCVLLITTFVTLSHAEIDSPPSMVRQPPADGLMFQVATGQDEKDKPFLLDCEASGVPAPTYKWFKSGRRFNFQAYDNRISQQPGRGTLVVTQPRPEDEGYYHCEASNEYGTSVSNAVFVRRSDLGSFPDEPPREEVIKEGEPLTLSCSPPTGFPKPQIFWIIQTYGGVLKSINNSRITVDPEGALHFSNVTSFDSYVDAHYACSASIIFRNEFKLGNKVKLTVLSSGSQAVQSRHAPIKQYCSPPNIVARRGEQQDIHCIFGGTPLPEIQWRKKNDKLDSNRYTVLNYGKTLRLNKVDFQDQGMYECTASNGVGSAQSWASSITVQSVPYWIIAPNNTNAAEEESVRFECKSSGEPTPSVKWYINGVELGRAPGNPRRKLISPTVLTIDMLTQQDTAVFQCNASNALGYAFKDFYLNVLSIKPEITKPPEALYETVDGASVFLHCRVFGAPQPTVTWMLNGRELTGGRYLVQQNGDLLIPRALFTDSGFYKCVAKNKLANVSSDDSLGELKVRERTKILAEPEDYEVAAGKSAKFRCNAVADISLQISIEWQANGQTLDFVSDPRMYQSPDEGLIITKTTELDSGVYKCIAKTKLDNVSAEATLTVQDKPNAPRLVGVECKQKTALVEWQPMGDNRSPILVYDIQSNTSFTPETWQNAFLDIPASGLKFEVSLSPWANYSFRVIAKNKIGYSKPSIHSSVCETPPDVPYNNPEKVQGMGTLPDNLVITWTRMDRIEHNGPGFFYRVFWKRALTGMDWQIVDIGDWKQTSLVINNQPTYQPYNIRVEAHNIKGQANLAAVEVIGHSGEDRPQQSPKNLVLLRLIDANTADLAWNPVPPETVRGHFKGYKIQAWTREETPESGRQVFVFANVSRSRVSVLFPFSENFVRVMAYNGRHEGPPSDVLTIRTPEGKPGSVSSFEAVAMGSSALKLTWGRPKTPNGNLLAYHIFYERVDGYKLYPEAERKPKVVNPHATSARLVGLEPATKYRVTIYAETKPGLGAEFFIEAMTGDHVKRPPDKPSFSWSRLESMDGRAGVMVTWNPNLDGHAGSHFFVEYRRKDETDFQKTKDVLYEESVSLTNLEPGTLYEIRVIAVDGRYFMSSDVEEIETVGAISAPRSTDALSNAGWFIGMLVAILLLTIVLIIVCLVKRNRGGKYSVHDKEAAQGKDLDYPEEAGFHEYSKPPGGDGNNVKGSRMSLNSSMKPGESDTDSMAEYGEGDTGKFTEDGSFIGQYGKKRSEQDETSPSALATFV